METLQHLAETLFPTPASLEGVALPPVPPVAAGLGALQALWDGNPSQREGCEDLDPSVVALVVLHGQEFELSACVNSLALLQLWAKRKGSAGQTVGVCELYPDEPGRSDYHGPYAGAMATLWAAVCDRGGQLEAPYPR